MNTNLPDDERYDPLANESEPTFAGFEGDGLQANGGEPEKVNPYLAAWNAPRSAVRVVVAEKSEALLVVFVMIAGISNALGEASSDDLGLQHELPAILGIAIVSGSISGLLGWCIIGWLVGVTGRWLGGQANARQVRAALGWVAYMGSVVALVWIPYLALFGHEIFTPNMPSLNGSGPLAFALFALSITQIVTGIWMAVAGCKMVGEVHGFSAWRGLGAFILAGLLILVPVLAIGLALAAFA